MKWETTTLGSVSGNIQTGPFGSQLHQSDYSEFGTPVVMPKDLIQGKISEETIARVSEEHVVRLPRHKIQNGDILYSRRGDVGRCAYATAKEEGWLCGTGCLRVTIDTNKADSKFVFYQLQLPTSIGWVENHAVGSTMLNLNTGILTAVPLKLPSLSVQRKIASILSAYDDLIENNKKQIKLLEEAAQRLYKEWFVDLRFPGHENVPVVDGVPAGWERCTITDLLKIGYGKDHKKLSDGDIPAYGSGGMFRKVNQKLHSGEAVLIPRKGTLNNIIHVDSDFWTIDTMFFGVPKFENCAKYAYFYLKSQDMYSYNIGAAVPSMTVNILDGMEILLPTKLMLKKFERTIEPLFSKQKLLAKQNETLTLSRDFLLPKLMSGEIEV